MRRIMRVCLVLCLLFCLITLKVLAKNESYGQDPYGDQNIEDAASDEELQEIAQAAVDNNTKEEIEYMQESKNGAEIRILQLRRAVLKSQITAKEVIKVLSGKNTNVSELGSILAEIEVLKDETENLDSSSETAVEDYVNIKRDLISLNRQFKSIASPLLSADSRQKIQEAVKDALDQSEELKAIHKGIKTARMNFIADRVERLLNRMEATNDELIQKIRDGEATKNEVSLSLKEAFEVLGPEKKIQIRRKFKAAIKNRIELKNKTVEKIRSNHLTVRRERLEKRLEKIPLKMNQKIKVRGG